MNSNIVMNLYADVAAQCQSELSQAGYTPPSGGHDETVRAYLNVRHRRVSVRPRKVHKASYITPPDLVVGEEAFLKAVEAGDDLRPYQSTKLLSPDFEDGMLNDFDLQHFHLGTIPHPRNPFFKARTGPVLFALVTQNDFYCIGCYPHKQWQRQEALDIINATWPDLTKAKVLNASRLAFNPSDEQIKQLRQAGISPVTQRPDGTVQASPGGGSTLNGSSAKVQQVAIQIREICGEWENQITKNIEPKIVNGEIAAPATVQLVHENGAMFAIVAGVSENLCKWRISSGHQLAL